MPMHDYLEMLRRKPEEVRTKIALLSSSAVTAVIALGWVVALATSGSFGVSPSATPAAIAREDQAALGNLVGAVGALGNTRAETSGLVIVEEDTSSTIKEEQPEATVIPF